jgi:hypothetical protein
MAGGAPPNPFTADNAGGQYGNAADYGTPNNAFAAPGPGVDAPYTDEFGWGPSPRISVSSTPDAMRLQSFPVRTFRPEDSDAPEVFYRPLDADDAKRHAVEEIDADGYEIRKDQLRRAADPRWTPPAETRITERLSPRTYQFFRPFDQGTKGNGARTLNGTHFSMADHRRDYDILGMRPYSARRNTYRADPTPWDADMYDVPDPTTVGTFYQGRFQAEEIPPTENRYFRL